MSAPRLKIGVVRFPGSNCEQDSMEAVSRVMGATVVPLWYGESDLQGVQMVILPGGFSYGDYLRSGAIARFAPMMRSVMEFAVKGYPVLGICNGFQVLTESGLLPGALVRNANMRFVCERNVPLQVVQTDSIFTVRYTEGQTVHFPVAHGEGNYVADADTLMRLEDNNQVVFRYLKDVNGSAHDIAGITNERGNVLGMMPHPERNLFRQEDRGGDLLWTGDGEAMFLAMAETLSAMSAVG